MATLQVGPSEALYYEHTAPTAKPFSFVFVNALTGSTEQWEAAVAPGLRDLGFGTLSYNFRGQAKSPFAAGKRLDEELIVRDLARLIDAVQIKRPVLVGLSIGGLFAAKAHLSGLSADGLVLINTLRKQGLSLDWVNEAIYRTATIGGSQLVMDLFLPMLVCPDFLAKMRASCLSDDAYEPFPADSGLLNLIANSRAADWNIAYEQLHLPCLVVTGLRDRVFLDRSALAELLARMPNARHIQFDNVGHLIPAEAPEPLVDALAEFVGQLEG